MEARLRQSGIQVLGEVPWGSHLCHFFETKEDLFETLLPYFKAGLEESELCFWAVEEPLAEGEARNALRGAIPDLDRHLRDGRIEIRPAREWYLTAGDLDCEKVKSAWDEKLDQALQSGFSGLRVNGSAAWLSKKDWGAFSEYEEWLNDAVSGKRMIVLCSYPLASVGGAEILDVARTHQLAIARRAGSWEVVETPELRQAKQEISKLNAGLEQRVVERTRQLETVNQELRREIEERKRAEGALKTASRRLLTAQEDERRRVAVELHDQLGQLLTLVKLDLQSLEWPSRAGQARGLDRAIHSVDQAIEQVRDLALDLRPSLLDDLGLPAALRWYVNRLREGVDLRFHVSAPEIPRPPHEIETICFRVGQAALTNVLRHAKARTVWVDLHMKGAGLELVVRDDGIGFDEALAWQQAIAGRSLGLLGMHERTAMVGGTLSVRSAEGKGTEIRARFPIYEKASNSGYVA